MVCPDSKGGEQLLGYMNRDTFHRLKDRIVNPLYGIWQMIFQDCVRFWPLDQQKHGQMVGSSVEGIQGGEGWSTCPMGRDWGRWGGLGWRKGGFSAPNRLQAPMRGCQGDGSSLITPVQGRRVRQWMQDRLSLSKRRNHFHIETVRQCSKLP